MQKTVSKKHRRVGKKYRKTRAVSRLKKIARKKFKMSRR